MNYDEVLKLWGKEAAEYFRRSVYYARRIGYVYGYAQAQLDEMRGDGKELDYDEAMAAKAARGEAVPQ